MLPSFVDWEAAWSSLVRQSGLGAAAGCRKRRRRSTSWRRTVQSVESAATGGGRRAAAGLRVIRCVRDADEAVREFASQLVEALGRATTPAIPVLPPFNEVTWTQYPAGFGHISAHCDPPVYGGIIAVATLRAEARFVAHSDAGEQHEWLTGQGDIVLLTGRGWPTERSRCPLHAVDPPKTADRLILTLLRTHEARAPPTCRRCRIPTAT